MDKKESTKLYFKQLKACLDAIDLDKISMLIDKLEGLLGTEKTLFVAGNGGSATTSSHMVCDLQKNILGTNIRDNKKRLRVISLNDNIPTMTAWGNDEGYQYIFSEQLKSLGKTGDLLLVLTCSGNSVNILEVIKTGSVMERD